jgi:hypothetical protein
MSEFEMFIELIASIILVILILFVWKKLSDCGMALPY